MSEHASESPNLEEREQDQAHQHAPLRAMVIHEIIRAEGEAELKRPISAMVWSGLAAGMSMGFSFAGQAILRADLPEGPGQHILGSLGYALGFIIVVLGRQQLFTESTLTAVLPVLNNRDLESLAAMLKLWVVVFLANIVGTWIFAAALAFGHPLPPEVGPSLTYLAGESVAHPFWNTLLRAVFAGWLIALMVWLLPSARTARILVIAVLTWAVAAAKFSHIIAGSAEGAYAVLTGQASVGAYWGGFVAPTLIGNIIGGASLTALLNYAPVAGEMAQDEAQDGEDGDSR